MKASQRRDIGLGKLGSRSSCSSSESLGGGSELSAFSFSRICRSGLAFRFDVGQPCFVDQIKEWTPSLSPENDGRVD